MVYYTVSQKIHYDWIVLCRFMPQPAIYPLSTPLVPTRNIRWSSYLKATNIVKWHRVSL